MWKTICYAQMTTDWLPQTVSRGFWILTQIFVALPRSAFYLRWGNDKAPQFVDSTWMFTLTFKRKLTNTCHRSNNTGHEITPEEDSFPPFPCQIKHKNCRGGKNPTQIGGWSTSGDDQHTARSREGAFPSGQLLADVMMSNTPSSAKGTHILSIYKSYSGSPYMRGFPINIKKISWGHDHITKKRVWNAHFG